MTNLSEDLKRYKQLLGYDPRIGGDSINEKRYHSYAGDTDYAEGDEEETEETETEGFGEEGGEETEGEDNADFDFGGEETEEGGEEEATEEGEEEGDEFGTADEFSAADELESEDDETEEIDVTDIVKRADDAKGYAEKAVAAAEQGKNMIQDLMSKFDALQTSLSKIDTVANELNTIKSDLQAQKPKEKLELRSLDSYPFNVKLTDYWDDEKLKDNYEITSRKPDGKSPDGNTKVWKLNPEEVKDYSSTDIKKSFVPESRSKKKVLTENKTADDVTKMFNLLGGAVKVGPVLKAIQYLIQGRESEVGAFANLKVVEGLKKYIAQIPQDKLDKLKTMKGEEIQNVFSKNQDSLKKLMDYVEKLK